MNNRQAAVLRAVRVFGPCTRAEIVQRTSPPGCGCDVGNVLHRLSLSGLVTHDEGGRWDVTDAGRAEFEKLGRASE